MTQKQYICSNPLTSVSAPFCSLLSKDRKNNIESCSQKQKGIVYEKRTIKRIEKCKGGICIAKSLNEIVSKFADKPISERTYIIDGKEYNVVSHYVGNKDIDTVLSTIAKKRAYEDIRNLAG